MALVSCCSSSYERRLSRSWMKRRPSASATIPTTGARPETTASGEVTASAATSLTPSTSSTGRARVRRVVRARSRCAASPYSCGGKPKRCRRSRTGMTVPWRLITPRVIGGACGRGDTATMGSNTLHHRKRQSVLLLCEEEDDQVEHSRRQVSINRAILHYSRENEHAYFPPL